VVVEAQEGEEGRELQRSGGAIMTQTTMDLKPHNPFQKGSQTYRLLEWLLNRPIYNIEIAHDLKIMNTTGRVSDLRRKGFDVRSKPVVEGGSGLWMYWLNNAT